MIWPWASFSLKSKILNYKNVSWTGCLQVDFWQYDFQTQEIESALFLEIIFF